MVVAGVRSYRKGHLVVTQEVAGSSPAAPANHGSNNDGCGPLAQLAEHRTFNPQVLGSNPRRPTIIKFNKIKDL